jgi:hypothetical protein
MAVAARVLEAVDGGRGFSLIRFGDGELFTLAQNTVLPADEVRLAAPFLFERHGVVVPNAEARDLLAGAFWNADLVGVPTSRRTTYSPMFLRLAAYHGWPIHTRPLTLSVINYMLYEHTDLYQTLLRRCRVLLVGNRSADLARRLGEAGFDGVVGHVAVPQGVLSVRAALDEIETHTFDVAFVAAGIAACLICPVLARQGKVALDFGILADDLTNPALGLPL